ncbi:MAG TPA: GNAT family N-acetyltransferase [Jatrophihabitans sp.]
MLDASLVGSRVVVRYRRPERDADPPFSDVVGELVAFDEATVTLHSRRGPVVLARSGIVAAKAVAADRRSVLELEGAAAAGWRPAEQLDLDGWLLRANDGWTSRGNSVLPLGTPQRPLPELLATVQAFYAERGLPAQFQIPLPARGLLDADLAGRCWRASDSVLVLTKRLAPDEHGHGIDDQVFLEAEPTGRWQAGYHARDGRLPEAALGLLRRHETVLFASLVDAGSTVAIARGAVDADWLGITLLEVDADRRRHGLGRRLMAAVEAWGATHSASRAYLQVTESNVDAIAMYRRLGYTEHHPYHYRIEPT